MNDGLLTYVTGSSRTGKGFYVLRKCAKRRRVVVYDPKDHPDEWPGYIRITRASVLAKLLASAGKKPFKIRLSDSNLKEFPGFCEVVAKYATTGTNGKDLVVVGDELADVTTPGKAPVWWGAIVRKLKGFGSDIFAMTQRPAESDKTAIGNADKMVSFHMTRKDDRVSMAKEMGIDVALLDALPPKLHGYEKTHGQPPKKIKLPGK